MSIWQNLRVRWLDSKAIWIKIMCKPDRNSNQNRISLNVLWSESVITHLVQPRRLLRTTTKFLTSSILNTEVPNEPLKRILSDSNTLVYVSYFPREKVYTWEIERVAERERGCFGTFHEKVYFDYWSRFLIPNFLFFCKVCLFGLWSVLWASYLWSRYMLSTKESVWKWVKGLNERMECKRYICRVYRKWEVQDWMQCWKK